MDKKDEKILVELIKNSRISFNQLAKKVGVSREVATYRVTKLVEAKIITDFYPVITIEKLGYFRNGCWMQLKNIDEAEEDVFFSFLKEHPFITCAGIIVGKWNIAFDIISKDRAHLVRIIQEILNKAGRHIGSYIIANSSAEQEFYPTKIIGIAEKDETISSNKLIKLDQTDKHLLSLLSENSRADYVALSSKMNLSANAVKYRIKRLEAVGILEQYTIAVDTTQLGFEFYNLQIKLDQGAEEKHLKEFLRKHPKVVYFYKYLGNENWDLDIGILAKNSYDLRRIIMEFRKELWKTMIIHDIYSTVKILKANITPKGIFE